MLVNRGKHEVGTAPPPPPPPPPNQNCSITSTIVLKPDLRHIELDIEKHLKVELDIKLDSDAQLCPRFLSKDLYQNQAGCQAGPSCPYRHSTSSTLNFQSTNNIPNDSSNSTKNNNSNSLHSKTVCKHWLRGLCKKGSGCEFLHEYNLRTMPECWFFGKYGFCSNGDECMYLHVDERMRVLECMDFRRGFCPKGVNFIGFVILTVLCISYFSLPILLFMRYKEQIINHCSLMLCTKLRKEGTNLPTEAHPPPSLCSLLGRFLPLRQIMSTRWTSKV
ncbi:hypothetical protein BY996DRAFT_6814914 [Phakopsora pachyrhizi]|nr:hypothetical protein BY996DRAFT_6814914 [Phakopsora pachyrhizi]